MLKEFDLNIERVLEDWEVHHALREVIANAMDEQALTGTEDIRIQKDEQSRWQVRDFGRGLKYEHLTQNENAEKLSRPDLVIGKFGVGLKDALATLDRHGVGVRILSRYGDITLGKSSKHGFDDVVTLHALIREPSDASFVGTEFVFEGVKDKDVELAKDFFLKFSDEQPLERTQYGQVLKKGTSGARIYVNGVRVAEEDNFLFSYNVTSLTQAMRKALNRERTHVGRTAYTERIKAILSECTSGSVAELLVFDLKEFETGQLHDELRWIDVAVHACKLLNAVDNVVFLTPSELVEAKDMVDSAIKDGYKVVSIPNNVKEKISGAEDLQGGLVRDLSEYMAEWNQSFEFEFVDENDLTEDEKEVFRETERVLRIAGGRPRNVKSILISETMRMEVRGYSAAVGVWENHMERIVIKRSQLKNLKAYAAILIHEVAHARSGATDVTREFENELTDLLGVTTVNAIDDQT